MMGGMGQGQGGIPPQALAMLAQGQGGMPGGMPMQPGAGMQPGASPIMPQGGVMPGAGPIGAMGAPMQHPMSMGPMGGMPMPQPQLPPGATQGGPQNQMAALMGAPGGVQQGAIPQLLAALQNLKNVGPNISAVQQQLHPYGNAAAGNNPMNMVGPGGTVGGGT